MYETGLTNEPLPPGSHLVHYYRLEHDGDAFAGRYVEKGLAAGECCILTGDPAHIQRVERLLPAPPAAGWPGRLFTFPVDAPPSYDVVKDFLAHHARIAPRGPLGMLPEASIPTTGPAPSGVRFRVLGNLRHWTSTEAGSHMNLEICAALEHLYRGSSGIIACQWETAGRSAALRWGGLFLHTHMVAGGSCLPRPSEAIERCLHGGTAQLEESSMKLQLALALGETADAFRVSRQVEEVVANLRQIVAPLTASTAGRLG